MLIVRVECYYWGSEVSKEASVAVNTHTKTHTHTHRHTHTHTHTLPLSLKCTHSSSGKCGGFSFHAASGGWAEAAVRVGGAFILHQPLRDNNMYEFNWEKCCQMEIPRVENINFVDSLRSLTRADSEWWV